MRVTNLSVACALIAAACVVQAAPPQAGPKLKIAFSAGSNPKKGFKNCSVDVTFMNGGKAPLMLMLGYRMGAGGKVLLPSPLSFNLKNKSNGKQVTLLYAGGSFEVPSLAEEAVATIQPGGSHKIKVALNDFRLKGASGPLALAGGSYVLTAELHGPVATVNELAPGSSSDHLWHGSAKSSGIPFNCQGSKDAKAAPASSGGG